MYLSLFFMSVATCFSLHISMFPDPRQLHVEADHDPKHSYTTYTINRATIFAWHAINDTTVHVLNSLRSHYVTIHTNFTDTACDDKTDTFLFKPPNDRAYRFSC